MAQGIYNLQPRGAVGGKERSERRDRHERYPDLDHQAVVAEHVEAQRNGLRLCRWDIGDAGAVDEIGNEEGHYDTDRRSEKTQDRAFEQELLPDTIASDAQRARRSDLVGALH